jgi:hypothetical protein
MVMIFTTVTAVAEDSQTKAGQDTAETEQENMQAEENAAETQPEDAQTEADAKEMSGMSIVGNDEAPKSLYIVPWKSSEIGVESSLNTMLNEGDMPVDREVFKRQLEFYHVSTAQ